MIIFLKLVKALAKYGSKAVKFAWAHKKTILKYIERGFTLAWLVDWVRDNI
jgi:hypothetical protein